MTGSGNKGERDGLERLREHARDCAECKESSLPLEVIALALSAEESLVSTDGVSRRVMSEAMPLLALRARRAYRTRLVRSMLLTLSPLPLIAWFDAYMLREAYSVLSGWLPAPVVAWMLVGYAAMLLLLCALTYAALPLLMTHPRVET